MRPFDREPAFPAHPRDVGETERFSLGYPKGAPMGTTEQADDAPAAPPVVGLRTKPGRYVFTEEGNADGWIASDYVVDPDP